MQNADSDRRKILKIGFVLAVSAVGAVVADPSGAKGSVLTPGNTLDPVPMVGFPAGTEVVSESKVFSGTFGSAEVSGNLFSEVIDTGSGYDFVYQITNTGTAGMDPIGRLSLANFNGFTTDVSQTSVTSAYNTSIAPASGSVPATDATDPDSDGSVIAFDFNPSPGLGQIGLGATTYTLIVTTDATSYTQGDGSLTDDATANTEVVVPVYDVLTYVPEPGSVALMSVIGGLLAYRRRRVG